MKLKQNIGAIDRAIRLILALILFVLLLGGKVTGTLAIVLWIVAIISLVTGLIGWCGLYAVLGITTK